MVSTSCCCLSLVSAHIQFNFFCMGLKWASGTLSHVDKLFEFLTG